MNKISLRFRITLLVGIILVILTTVLTISSILSASHYFVSPWQVPININNTENIDFKKIEGFDIKEGAIEEFKNIENINPMTISFELKTAQKGFSIQSIVILISIIIIGLGVTYLIMGRALRPLTVLSETIHDINVHNLSKPIEGISSKDEVGSITVSFNGMLDRLKSSFEQQKRFSANAAHELKTPLATMKTSLQVLQMDDSPSYDDYMDTILIMEQNIERLVSIVNDLLLLSSEEKTEFEDEIPLHTLFYEIEEELRDAVRDKNIYCILPLNECIITGSRMLLHSAFYNIFENAIKYNKNNGTVEVTLQKTSDGKTIISISDTGIGMSEEDLERAFEPFFRADSPCVRQIAGNGLGMSIIRTIIERHGGEINLESKINVGTKVIVVM